MRDVGFKMASITVKITYFADAQFTQVIKNGLAPSLTTTKRTSTGVVGLLNTHRRVSI